MADGLGWVWKLGAGQSRRRSGRTGCFGDDASQVGPPDLPSFPQGQDGAKGDQGEDGEPGQPVSDQ